MNHPNVVLQLKLLDYFNYSSRILVLVILFLLSITNDLEAQCSRTIQVNSDATLSTALTNALPGDCIVLANGTYAGFTISKDGTASNPIIIRAANQNQATISSGIIRFIGTSFVTIDGLKITTGGAVINVDDRDRKIIVSFLNTDNCRITNCDFKPTTVSSNTYWVMLNGTSNNNRVDHNEFGPTPNFDIHYVWPCGNETIVGVTKPVDRTPWAEGNGPFNPRMARNTKIDHNHFRAVAAGNGGEAIVLGGIGMTGDYQMLGTIVEYNLFEDCSGDSEVISIKSSGNIIRYNTLRRCKASIVSRAGNQNRIEGNFIFGEGVSGTGGIRFYEKDHVIFNNYIETVSPALLMANGDLYTKDGFSHAQTFRAKITHNTFISASGGAVNLSYSSHLEKPVDPVFANNIIRSTSGECVVGETGPSNPVYSQNILTPTGTGTPGASGTGWLAQDPQLTRQGELLKLTSGSSAIGAANTNFYSFVTDDADGHLRNDPDIGSDEFSTGAIIRKPLTGSDVGPGSNQAPTVSISSPANGATFTAPASVTINATASDSDGSITKVEFFQGATKLGEDASSPYSFTWSNVPAGSYSLTAKATDNVGAVTTSSAVSITVDASDPGSVIVTTIHDAYVRNGVHANTTHGTTDPTNLITKVAPATQVDNSRETYLMFDLTGVSGTITSVNLKVFGKIEDLTVPNIPVGIFSVANTSWTESAITWNTKPATSASSLQSAIVTDATARYYNWDVTNYVKSEVAAGRKKISLAMKSGVEHNPRILWNSKETGSNPPQLTLAVDTSNVAPIVSITGPANGATFTAPATITINVNASDSDGSVTKVEFFGNNTLLGEDTTAPYSFTWNNVPAGVYEITVVATDNLGAQTPAAISITVIEPGGLPVPWSNTDIGAVAAAGSANFSDGNFTLTGSGADIWSTADEFHYVHQPLSGDVEIIARVNSLTNTNAWAKAGVMIRESLAAGSTHAMVIVTPTTNGVSFQRRMTTGGTSASTASTGAIPAWLKMTRVGNNFTAASSTNGTNWTTIGTVTIVMTSTVQVGLVLTSHSDGTLATATFSNVSATAIGPPCPPPTASADDGNVAANVIDNDFATRWSASGDPQWIQLCLDNTSSVNGVQIAFYKGNERTSNFDVLVSLDGTTFTPAATGLVSSGTSLALETFSFPAKDAKHVRIVGHGNSLNLWNSYTEVRITTSSSASAGRSNTTTEATPSLENNANEELISYPNPASLRVTIQYHLKKSGQVQLSLYNSVHNKTIMVINEDQPAGSYSKEVDLSSLPKGLHLIKLLHNGRLKTHKLIKR